MSKSKARRLGMPRGFLAAVLVVSGDVPGRVENRMRQRPQINIVNLGAQREGLG